MNKSKWLVLVVVLGTILCACGKDNDTSSVSQNSDSTDSRMVSIVKPEGRLYELGKKSKYEYEEVTSFTEIDDQGSDYGVFQIAGDLREVASVDGFATYEVSSGCVLLSYLPSYTLNDALEQEWHLGNDTSKSVNGEKIGNKISSGAVIVQISNDGEHWVTDQKMYDICGTENDVVNLYETKKIQQMNGCYYKVIVAYETERKPEKDTECRKNIEEYKFCIKDCANYPNKGGEVVSDNMTFVNTGKDNDIDEKDPHYGWELGSFTIRGYSSCKENTSEEETKCYIQEKEGSVTLSFKLDKDINFINGNEKLTIYSDRNGWDKYFQVDDTEFKQGMLIIQYTDMEGRKYKPNVYPDFLNLYAKTGEDTQIPLWGPGDYEVALDYEVKSGFGSYDNYKKSFKFKIRNKGEEEPDINKSYFGKLYELEEKYEYTETSPYEPIALSGSQFGVFSLSGNTAKTDYVNGYDAYDCSGDEIWLCYSPSGTLVDAPESDWHVVTEKKNKINNEKLDEKIRGGAIVLQTSKDGEHWLKADEKTDITSDDFYTGFYDTKEIQLINGCYYRVIVAYAVERLVGDSKENKKYIEVYEFNLKNDEDEKYGKGAHPGTEYLIGDKRNTINTGKDNDFYVPDNSTGWGIFESDDPYSGDWEIGTFTIRGFTDKEKNDQGEYVFLKTNGDVIKMTFDLGPDDINCLNDCDNLIINSDKNGYDQNFGVNVNEFEHGTLIIRYTDPDNTPYTYEYVNFLEANASTEADTSVMFFEEGDYEVALDFEIKNKNSLFKKYSNYKMYFKFSIRNGKNTMYAFEKSDDGSKGSQLNDRDVTPNGFYIDLAGSQYITVDVTKYELVGNNSSKRKELLWNNPANDGDVFDEPGIYEVKFTNKDQSRDSYTKTYYVGTDPFLMALSVNGLEVEELNEKLSDGYQITDEGELIKK